MTSEFTVLRFSSFNQVMHLSDDWDAFVIEQKAPLSMSFDWCKTWWKHYGKGKHLVILIFFSNSKIIAILPMYFDDVPIFFGKVRIARIVGADIPPKVFNPPVNQDHSTEVFKKFYEILFENLNCDLVSFGPISENYLKQMAIGEFLNFATAKGSPYLQQGCGVNNILTLPATFDEYLNNLKRNYRSQIRRIIKNTQRKLTIAYDEFNAVSDFDKLYEEFIKLHTTQWNKKGKLGHFFAYPNAQQFNKNIAAILSHDGRTIMGTLKADDHIVFRHYSVLLSNILYMQFSARDTTSVNEKYSIGYVGLLKTIESAIENGITAIDVGIGEYLYKKKLGFSEEKLFRIRLIAPGFVSRLKGLMFIGLFHLLDIVYYKTWYRRLQPKLPSFFHLPISSFWLRISI